ncbi:MAG TPA: TVP38/TMEM64 family protein [Peptococcaceae bacterium]|nr:TVP38/TMEM64 family protein [Peptococcaceae bacterium]
MLKKLELSVLVNLILLAVFLGVVFFITWRYSAQVYELISEPEEFKSLLASYGHAGILVFICFQILQVVVASIPGELVQIAGGYIFGTLAGTVYSAIGIMLGYFLVFALTRFLGYPLVKVFVSTDKIAKLTDLIKNKKSTAFLFSLFLVPGIPKDFLVYAAGLTPIEPVKFFTIVFMARFPALFGASFIGAHLEQQNYSIVVSALILAVFLLIVGFMYKKQVISVLSKSQQGLSLVLVRRKMKESQDESPNSEPQETSLPQTGEQTSTKNASITQETGDNNP